MSWRCRFAETKDNDLVASNWTYNHEKENSLEIKLTQEL
jgi:hypothetical protein